MKYLLDTNICIYLIKKKSKILLKKIQKYKTKDIGISSITIAELEYGIEKSKFRKKNREALKTFLIPFEILPFNESASFEYGKIRADLERKGKIIGSMDLLIAAHSKANNLILVTNNEKEFKRVKGLKIDNWIK